MHKTESVHRFSFNPGGRGRMKDFLHLLKQKIVGEAMNSSLFSLLVLAGSIFPAQAAVHYVRAAAQGTNDGSKWLDAYTRMQDALAAASPGDEIWVAKGTYYPSDSGDRTASFVLQNGVEIYGGFSGLETSRAERQPHFIDCILSGDR